MDLMCSLFGRALRKYRKGHADGPVSLSNLIFLILFCSTTYVGDISAVVFLLSKISVSRDFSVPRERKTYS